MTRGADTGEEGGQRASVLIVDHGLSYGGTLVVAGHLLRHLDSERFRGTLVTAAGRSFAEYHTRGSAEVVEHRPRVTYAAIDRMNSLVRRLPTEIGRRSAGYLVPGARFAGNTPYLFRLMRLMRRVQASIVHCNNGLDNVEAMMAAIATGTPVLLHVHGIGGAGRVAVRLALQVEAPVIAVSSAVAEAVVAVGVPESRVTVIPNPVEGEPTRVEDGQGLRARLGIRAEDPLIGIVGRVMEWKGQREFLQAAALVLEKIPFAHAVVVGDTGDFDGRQYLQMLEAFVKSRPELLGRVHFLGFVKDMGGVYPDLDVVVHSSIAPEPFGLVITEAMSHGCPVIASPLGAPGEIISHGVDGFLVEPTRPDRVAAHVLALLGDPELRARVVTAAKAMVRERYDPRAYAHQVEAVYDSLLPVPRGR